jgi:small neutral amino acid transporter SnatA (MarC family)
MFHWSFTILLAAIVFCVLSFSILSPVLALVGKSLLAVLIGLSLASLAVEFLLPIYLMQKHEKDVNRSAR